MAGKIALDLKQFRHISSDDKSTRLQHKDGHELTIAHSPLSKDMRAQLEALKLSTEKEAPKAKHGKVSVKDQEKEQRPVGNVTVKQEPAQPNGKIIQKFAEGGGAEPVRTEDPDSVVPLMAQFQQTAQPPVDDTLQAKRAIYNDMSQYRLRPMGIGSGGSGFLGITPESSTESKQFGPNGEAPVNFDAETWKMADAKYNALLQAKDAQAHAQSAHIAEQNAQRVAAGLPPLEGGTPRAPQSAQEAQPMAQEPQQAAPQAPPPQDPMAGIMNGQQDMMMGGLNEALAGFNAEAQAKGDLGIKQAAALDENIRSQHTAQANFQHSFDQLEQERQAHIKDIQEGYIDPNAYWKDHSKVATGIGMILAGFNPTANPDGASNFLKFQMEQNLAAQRENLSSKNNLLAANLKQFGNLKDATDMTRIMQHDIMANELMSAAGKAASPMAKAAAMQAAGKLKLEVAPRMQELAMRRAMMQAVNSTNGADPDTIGHMIARIRPLNPELAKSMEERFVPGIGLSETTPVPADIRKELTGKANFDMLARKYQAFAKKHSGSLSVSAINQGKAMALELQNAYRNSINGGVYKEGEQNMIEKIIPSDPTQFFSSMRTNPKLQELIDTNFMNGNNLRRSYKLPVAEMPIAPNSRELALEFVRANPKDPRTPRILKALGQ